MTSTAPSPHPVIRAYPHARADERCRCGKSYYVHPTVGRQELSTGQSRMLVKLCNGKVVAL